MLKVIILTLCASLALAKVQQPWFIPDWVPGCASCLWCESCEELAQKSIQSHSVGPHNILNPMIGLTTESEEERQQFPNRLAKERPEEIEKKAEERQQAINIIVNECKRKYSKPSSDLNECISRSRMNTGLEEPMELLQETTTTNNLRTNKAKVKKKLLRQR